MALRCRHVAAKVGRGVLPYSVAVDPYRHVEALEQPRILSRGLGFLFVDKPTGLRPGFAAQRRRALSENVAASGHPSGAKSPRDLYDAVLDSEGLSPLDWASPSPQAVFGSQHERKSSGVALVALSRAAAAESTQLWHSQRSEELYTAVVRGRLHLNDVITISRKLCRPTEGSKLWRLAGRRMEGNEATTLARGLMHGVYGGEACTLVELRPVTGGVQQLRLHCVAMGHPIVGDEGHDADRRLDWRFERPLPAARLMLHCSYMRVPFRSGSAEAVAPDTLCTFLDSATLDGDVSSLTADATRASPLLGTAPASGLTRRLSTEGSWDLFAGGIGKDVIDDTHWDVYTGLKRFKGPPFGPPEWCDRAAAAIAREEKWKKKSALRHQSGADGHELAEAASGVSA